MGGTLRQFGEWELDGNIIGDVSVVRRRRGGDKDAAVTGVDGNMGVGLN